MQRRKSKSTGNPILYFFLLILVISGGVFIWFLHPAVEVEQIELKSDADGDGVYDLADFIEGARLSIANKTYYHSAYYEGGYPPDGEGVCSDVIWRAFDHAGYNLKEMVDADIAAHPSLYPRVEGKPDPHIDFRRVVNLDVFFARSAAVLTLQLMPRDAENLYQWQGGDIVVVKEGAQYHIGMLSGKRNRNGVPYVIHHPGGQPREEDCLERWTDMLVGHYRYPTEE